jgi:hypothetical protein
MDQNGQKAHICPQQGPFPGVYYHPAGLPGIFQKEVDAFPELVSG